MQLHDQIMQTSWEKCKIYSCVLREECTLMCVMDGHALFYKCTNTSDECHGLLPELLLLEPEIDKTRRMLPFFVRREHRGFALLFRTAKNSDMSTGPLACPFAHARAPLTHSLAPPCSLRSRAPLHSFVCSLAHFTHSLARGKVYNLMSQFHLVLKQSAWFRTA